MSSSHSSPHSVPSSSGSVSGFPEEDLRTGGRDNPGYFAARLGQTFRRGRYCIVRKLGWGRYSSVWLARDKSDERFVALKILTCEATKALSGANQVSDELNLLQKIADAGQSHRGFKHNIAYYDSFEFIGPHGAHRCIIAEPLGCSLDHIRKLRSDGDRRLNSSTIKRVIRQVLHGLDYLHEVCKIVHADLKHDNILFRPENISAVISHELATSPSLSYDCGTEVCPPVIPIVSQSLPLSTAQSISENSLEAVVADLGHSHWRNRHFQEIIQPSALRAPEVILGYKWDSPADIWSLGCLVTELLIGFWLFEPSSNKQWSLEEDHLARMAEALETSFDADFLSRCEHNRKFFNADGNFAHFAGHDEPTWPIRKLLTSFSMDKNAADIEMAARFILRCLCLVPEKRATARELAGDPWLA